MKIGRLIVTLGVCCALLGGFVIASPAAIARLELSDPPPKLALAEQADAVALEKSERLLRLLHDGVVMGR